MVNEADRKTLGAINKILIEIHFGTSSLLLIVYLSTTL
jgi:hypothetical protein